MLDPVLVDQVVADHDIGCQAGVEQSLRVDDRVAILLRDAAGQFLALAIEDAPDRGVALIDPARAGAGDAADR